MEQLAAVAVAAVVETVTTLTVRLIIEPLKLVPSGVVVVVVELVMGLLHGTELSAH
jgi:hypothetical protein